MAFAAERILQSYLWVSTMPTAQAIQGISMLHGEGAKILRANGYTELNAFIPPVVEKAFGRRLERTFGWVRQWACWAIRF